MGKSLHKNKTKVNIPIRVAAVLLCLALFSMYLVTGLYARYATSVQSSDNARVAKFSIQGKGELITGSIEASLIPGESISATLLIENKSEVAVEYTVEVDNVTDNLPLSFRMEKKDGSSPDMQPNDTTFKAQQIPGNHTDQYTLYIDWKEDADLSRMGMVDYITVTVTAAQID